MHLENDHWSLRSTLSMLEGSNTKMLDYVKHKPRWRPPKGKTTESYPEDVLAFKQIYLSKASATYRKELLTKVDNTFYDRITAMRQEDAAREERLQEMNLSDHDPFQHIFEQNNMSADEIPGFFNTTSTLANAAKAGANTGASPTANKKGGAGGKRGGRNVSTLMKHEAPSIDVIRQRIEARRNQIQSIGTSSHHSGSATEQDRDADEREAAFQAAEGLAPVGKPNPPMDYTGNIAGYVPASSRRRNSDQSMQRSFMVGEVADTIQDQFEDMSYGGASHLYRGSSVYQPSVGQQKWPYQDQGEDQSMLSYSSRLNNALPVGMYQRVSTRGAGANQLVAAPTRAGTAGGGRMITAQRRG